MEFSSWQKPLLQIASCINVALVTKGTVSLSKYTTRAKKWGIISDMWQLRLMVLVCLKYVSTYWIYHTINSEWASLSYLYCRHNRNKLHTDLRSTELLCFYRSFPGGINPWLLCVVSKDIVPPFQNGKSMKYKTKILSLVHCCQLGFFIFQKK